MLLAILQVLQRRETSFSSTEQLIARGRPFRSPSLRRKWWTNQDRSRLCSYTGALQVSRGIVREGDSLQVLCYQHILDQRFRKKLLNIFQHCLPTCAYTTNIAFQERTNARKIKLPGLDVFISSYISLAPTQRMILLE